MFGNPYYNGQAAGIGRLNTYSPYLNGRLVTGADEARAAQIELDGSMWYFPSPSENKIYVKSINMNGMPVFCEYLLTNQPNTIEQRIANLENIVKGLINNGTNSANADAIKQPDGDAQ